LYWYGVRKKGSPHRLKRISFPPDFFGELLICESFDWAQSVPGMQLFRTSLPRQTVEPLQGSWEVTYCDVSEFKGWHLKIARGGFAASPLTQLFLDFVPNASNPRICSSARSGGRRLASEIVLAEVQGQFATAACKEVNRE
jgi:hypothetical protein